MDEQSILSWYWACRREGLSPFTAMSLAMARQARIERREDMGRVVRAEVFKRTDALQRSVV